MGFHGSARRKNSPYRTFFKRCFDMVAAGMLLLLLWPVLAIIAVAVLLDDGRPVLFRQERAGRDGRVFWITKFRTMRDVQSTRTGLAEEDRLTTVGSYLRISSLDELPELWNVV